jgi:hypothetical protein
VLRSLDKEAAPLYRRLILRNTAASAGDGDTVEFASHLERIKLTMARIVRGLYFLNNHGIRLPDSHKITIFVGREYLAYGVNNAEKLKALFSPLTEVATRGVGEEDVFLYLYSTATGTDPFATVWYLRFFGGYEFFAHSLPDGDQRVLATHFPEIRNFHLLPGLETVYVPSCAEFSQWAVEAMGGKFELPTIDSELPAGATTILHGRLGRYKGPRQ